MAEIIRTEKDGEREYFVYDNGGTKWCDNGAFRTPPPAAMITTSEKGRELVAIKMQQKRDAILRGAAHTLEVTGEFEKPTREDIAEALGQVVMERALDTDYKNSKQIEAARFILTEGGMSDDEQPEQRTGISQDALDKLYIIAKAVLAQKQSDVVEGEVK